MSKTTGIYVEVETRDLLKAQAKEAGMTLNGYLKKLAQDVEKMNNIIGSK